MGHNDGSSTLKLDLGSRECSQSGLESVSSTAYLFDFGESRIPVLGWLTAALGSLLALLAGTAVWLPLLAFVLFLYWAWLALQRARQRLRIYPDRIQVLEIHPGGRLWFATEDTQVFLAEVGAIDLRGSGLQFRRQDGRPGVVLLEGLSSKKKHQFHHLFDVQQRKGAIPDRIGFQEPGISSVPELSKIIFASAMTLWLLLGLLLALTR